MHEEKEVVLRYQLPNIMKSIRKALKLSQGRLRRQMLNCSESNVLGMSQESISYWESGKIVPGIASIRAWVTVVSSEITKLREFKERSEVQAAKERSKKSRKKEKDNEWKV